MDYPLEGLKVLDFSRVLAGPFAGRMLCDLGADVVKVEPPEGDLTRYWGREIGGVAGYYHQQNAGKRNICIDLRAHGAADLVKELVAEADILIENYRPGVMQRLGIDYPTLRDVNPGLIMLSISGFGQESPESRRPAFAAVVHAESGLLQRIQNRSGLELHDIPLSVADTNAALHGLVGLLSAVIMRGRTGQGQHLDIAMTDCAVATDDHLHYDLEDSWDTAPLTVVLSRASFGPVLLATDFRLLFKQLVTQCGLQDPALPEMDLKEKILARRQAVDSFLMELGPRDVFEDMMKQLNTPWGDVRDPACVTEQASVAHRGALVSVEDGLGGERLVTQSPYRFSAASSGVRGPAAQRGEHNGHVIGQWLGKSDSDLAALDEAGVLLYDPGWRHH